MGIFGKKKQLDEKFFRFDSSMNFQSKQRNDFSPDAFTFKHANILITIAMAKNWFGEETTVNSSTLFSKHGVSDVPEWAKDIEIDSSLLETDKYFNGYKRISWSESNIGKKFEEAATKLGAKTHLMPSPYNLSQNVLTGNWTLCDGRTLIQIGDVWKNQETAEEFIYWHIDALVRTRPPISEKKQDLATQIFLPFMFQSAAYLSESPFPSTPIVMRTRAEQFEVHGLSDIPRLAFLTEDNSRNFGTATIDNQMQAVFLWSPQITHYGYILEEKHFKESIDNILITVLDALPKVGDILADGYCNWGPNSELYFQSSCYADRTAFSQNDFAPMFLGEYVPGTLYAELDFRSQNVYNNSSNALSQGLEADDEQLVNLGASGLYNLMNYGVGSTFVHSMNSLFYTQFTNQEAFLGDKKESRYQDFIRDSEKVLRFATALPIDFQDANAYSNLASLYIQEERHKDALECINEGLKRINDANPNLSVSLLWSTDPNAILPVKLELMIHLVTIHLENDEGNQANKIAKEIVAIANEYNYSDGSVLAAEFILGQSDSGKPRN